MNDTSLVGPWIRRFLLEHMIGERNLALNTQASYRDTLVLLMPFISRMVRRPVDRLAIEHLSTSAIRLFLGHLEQIRGCSTATRNQRLAAIHALARFIGERSPEHIAWCAGIRSIPFKKTEKPAVAYLEKPEMDALLDVPDQRTPQGIRDYTLLQFLYNSGARADEAARLTVADLDLGPSPSVKIVGKGNKIRLCPLWSSTASALGRIVTNRGPSERVFLNCRQQPMTRFGVYALVKRTVLTASSRVPSLSMKVVSPHSIRHTAAVHLLRAGVDINTIRAWLGHVSVDTTNVYAEVDLEMKAKALAHCEVPARPTFKRWRKEPSLMAFLKGL